MVTEAGKEILRNSIKTANFHNKILEQNEMWKQWEIERGLTMMVSDDDILKKIRKNHRCSKHQKMAESQEWSRGNLNADTVAGTSSADRWDHDGFKELYPDESDEEKPSKSSTNLKEPKKWGHSGFHELYPDESRKARSPSASSSSKSFSKKSNQYSYEELYYRELCKQDSLSHFLNKRTKKRSLSFSPRRRRAGRSLSPSSEWNIKSNYYIDEEQYHKDLHKRASISPCLNKHAKRPSLSYSPRRCVRKSSSPIQFVMKSNHYICEEQYCKVLRKRTTLSPYINKHSKPASLSLSPRRHARRSSSSSFRECAIKSSDCSYEEQYRRECLKKASLPPHPTKRAKRRSKSIERSECDLKWDHNGFLELYPEEYLRKNSSRFKRV